MITEEQKAEFEKAAKPLMEYLHKNHHPHTKVIVDNGRAELVEGLLNFNRYAHRSDCSVNNGPAEKPGPCDCGASDTKSEG